MRAYLHNLPTAETHKPRHTVGLGRASIRVRPGVSPVGAQRGFLSGGATRGYLKIACSKCNNGWMSKLQNRAKSVLEAYIRSGWPSLTYTDCKKLSEWAIMTSMVLDQADQWSIGVSRDQRVRFAETQDAANWTVWTAPLDRLRFGGFNHLAVALMDADNPAVQIGIAQTTSLVVGTLFIMTCSSTCATEHSDYFNVTDALEEIGLKKLWPIPVITNITNAGSKILHEEALNEASNFLFSFGYAGTARRWNEVVN